MDKDNGEFLGELGLVLLGIVLLIVLLPIVCAMGIAFLCGLTGTLYFTFVVLFTIVMWTVFFALWSV